MASKAAENAARIAACFHVFELREIATFCAIGEHHMAAAWKIQKWHLLEAKRFFEGADIPEELRDAARLEEWLITACRKKGNVELPLVLTLNAGQPYTQSEGA